MRVTADDPDRDEIIGRHAQAVALGLSTYLDPRTRLSVFTEAYLAARGTCCRAQCRHCPWDGCGPT